jgi:hypothetical protein
MWIISWVESAAIVTGEDVKDVRELSGGRAKEELDNDESLPKQLVFVVYRKKNGNVDLARAAAND